MYASKLLPGCATRPAHKLSKFSTIGTSLHATTGRLALFSRATQSELLRICGYDEGSGRSAFNQSRRKEGWVIRERSHRPRWPAHREGTAPALSLTGNLQIMVWKQRMSVRDWVFSELVGSQQSFVRQQAVREEEGSAEAIATRVGVAR